MNKKSVKKFAAGLLSAAMLATAATGAIMPVYTSGAELIRQSDFEKGEFAPWASVESGDAKQSLSVLDGKLVVNVINNTGGDGRWDLRLRHRGFAIAKDHEYEIKCEITADKDGYIYSNIADYSGADAVWSHLGGKEWTPLKVKAGEKYEIKTTFKAEMSIENAEWSFQYADSLGLIDSADTGMPNGSTITFDNLSINCLTDDESGNCLREIDTVETAENQLFKQVDFNNGAYSPWIPLASESTKQNLSIRDGKLYVEVVDNKGDEARWDLQLQHRGLRVFAGNTYKISGEITCDKDGYIYARIGNIGASEDVWHHLSGEEWVPAKLKAGEVFKFTEYFVCKTEMEDAVFAFEYADNNGYLENSDTGIPSGAVMIFDNLSLEDVTGIEEIPVTTTKPATTTTTKATTTTLTTTNPPKNEELKYSVSIDSKAAKTIYNIGEELALEGVKISGRVTGENLNGDIFGQELTSLVKSGTVKVHTSEYNKDVPGTYKIYVTFGTAIDSYEVCVVESAATTTATTNPATTTTTTTTTISTIVYGDANCDGKVSIADATAILQALGNNDSFALTKQGELNADVIDAGGGLSAADAVAIQAVDAKLISEDSLPMKQADFEKAMK
ncbi:MAG: dockerin type I repeat-containing protein [Ruminococcus sp.]|nr:dockerin type I repeat-containing protein [Ruminococcus sp.]